MNANSFLTGFQVGRVLRGYREPEDNGDYVEADTVDARKEDLKRLMQGGFFEWRTLSDVGLRVVINFDRFGGEGDTFKKRYVAVISVDSGAYNGDMLGYIIVNEVTCIPGRKNEENLTGYVFESQDMLMAFARVISKEGAKIKSTGEMKKFKLVSTFENIPSKSIPGGSSWVSGADVYKLVCVDRDLGVSGGWMATAVIDM